MEPSSRLADASKIVIRRAELEEIIDLRHVVLRHGLPREEAIFAGDRAATSRHYGAFLDGRIVGCASLHASTWDGQPAWQLRGMASADSARRMGVGRRLLAFLEDDVTDVAPRPLWCNARIGALDFYKAMGWTIQSELFDIPTAGPHHRMLREG